MTPTQLERLAASPRWAQVLASIERSAPRTLRLEEFRALTALTGERYEFVAGRAAVWVLGDVEDEVLYNDVADAGTLRELWRDLAAATDRPEPPELAAVDPRTSISDLIGGAVLMMFDEVEDVMVDLAQARVEALAPPLRA